MTYRRTAEDLHTAWAIQLQALKISTREFDTGAAGEAARLANAVFLMVGRGMRRHLSICDAAGQQENRLYRSTAKAAGAAGNALVFCRLEKVGLDEWAVALRPAGEAALADGRDLPFDEWWNERVVVTNQHELTRAQIVRILRDKNGGAHFDVQVDDPLIAAALSGEIGGFWVQPEPGGAEWPVPLCLENCMRQIVEELWYSFRDPLDRAPQSAVTS